jgi:hypothetical protein
LIVAASREKSAAILSCSSDTGAAPAVAAADQAADLAFDLGSGGLVVGFPGRIVLAGTACGQSGFEPIQASGLGVRLKILIGFEGPLSTFEVRLRGLGLTTISGQT